MATKKTTKKAAPTTATKKLPNVLYAYWDDGGDKGDPDNWFISAQESIPADGRDWKHFGVYKRVGKGKARETVEKHIEEGARCSTSKS